MTFSLGSLVGVKSALCWVSLLLSSRPARRGVAMLVCDISSAVLDFFSTGLIEPFSGAWRAVRARRAGGRGMSGYAM
jgi:hypothetical protein